MLIRAELSRVLLDLTSARPAARLVAVRAAVPRAIALAVSLSAGAAPPPVARGRRGAGRSAPATTTSPYDPEEAADDDGGDGKARAIPAADRRRAVELLLGLWIDVARDVILVGAGGARSVHDTVLLDDLGAVSAIIPSAGRPGPGLAARRRRRLTPLPALTPPHP